MKKNIFLLPLVFSSFICIAEENEAPRITHGIAIGDVESRTAVIWSRADREAIMKVTAHSPAGEKIFGATGVRADDDYTGQILLKGLEPNTRYEYKVRFELSQANKSKGSR